MQGASGDSPTYRCWGDDSEDLTEKVEVAVAALEKETITFYAFRRETREPDKRRQVMVKCSKEHENVFDVET